MSNDQKSFFDDETIKDLKEVEDSLTEEQWRKMHDVLQMAKGPMMALLMHVFQNVLDDKQGVALARIGRRWMES